VLHPVLTQASPECIVHTPFIEGILNLPAVCATCVAYRWVRTPHLRQTPLHCSTKYMWPRPTQFKHHKHPLTKPPVLEQQSSNNHCQKQLYIVLSATSLYRVASVQHCINQYLTLPQYNIGFVSNRLHGITCQSKSCITVVGHSVGT
jgi:hypothetical protein